jgi:hypothetical protein
MAQRTPVVGRGGPSAGLHAGASYWPARRDGMAVAAWGGPATRPWVAARGLVRAQAAARSWNCSSSVEPFSAVVEDWPCWMAWVTASK